MHFNYLIFLAIAGLSLPAKGQEIQFKTITLDGADYSNVAVLKGAEGEEYGFADMKSRWPRSADGNTPIYVCWENYRNEYNNEHQLVQDAITTSWQANSRLQFIGWQPCTADSSGVRIYVSEDGPHTKGLGKALNGKPQGMVLNFTFNTWSESCQKSSESRLGCIKSIAVHEFGHAIGIVHEQNRPDKPGECRRSPQGSSVGAEMLTPYDPYSVMNYCNDKYNNDGKLSRFDVETVRAMYGGI